MNAHKIVRSLVCATLVLNMAAAAAGQGASVCVTPPSGLTSWWPG